MKKHKRENENLIFCKNCRGYYDPSQPQCPHCGEETKANTEKRRENVMSVTQYGGGFGSENSGLTRVAMVMIILLLLILLAVVGVLGMKALHVMEQLERGGAASIASVEEEQGDGSGDTSAALTQEEEAAQEAAAKQAAAEQTRKEAEEKATALINSKAKELSFNYTDITLSAGEATQLVLSVQPSSWTGDLTWTTSNRYVATVDATGKVTYVGGGECQVTVACKGATAECTVYCKGDAIAQKEEDVTASVEGSYPVKEDNKAEQTTTDEETEQKQDKKDEKEEEDEEKGTSEHTEPITLDYYDITLVDVGDPHTFQVSGGNGTYQWTSADPSVATVDANGRVVATGAGVTTITCTSGDQTQECVVRVK